MMIYFMCPLIRQTLKNARSSCDSSNHNDFWNELSRSKIHRRHSERITTLKWDFQSKQKKTRQRQSHPSSRFSMSITPTPIVLIHLLLSWLFLLYHVNIDELCWGSCSMRSTFCFTYSTNSLSSSFLPLLHHISYNNWKRG